MKAPKPGSSTFDPTTTVNKAVNDYLDATGTPNASVVLIFQGKEYFFPYSNPNITPTPPAVTETTVFELGSITKVFTATLLAYSGMPLSDAVTKHMPASYNFASNAGLNNITLQQLATHTSGMPNEALQHPSTPLFAGQPPSSALIAWWQNFNTPPVTPPAPPAPGTCWMYSNIAFVTLGFVVGGCNPTATSNYNQQLSQNILTPLGMTQTGATPPTGLTVAQGYIGPPSPTQTNAATGQAKDLKSTAQDMIIFLSACISPPSNSLGTAMALAQKPIISGIDNCDSTTLINFKQGLAWQISQLTDNYSVVWKDGATGIGGFEAWIGFIPTAGMGIVVMGNKFMYPRSSATSGPGKAGRTVLKDLLKVPNN